MSPETIAYLHKWLFTITTDLDDLSIMLHRKKQEFMQVQTLIYELEGNLDDIACNSDKVVIDLVNMDESGDL